MEKEVGRSHRDGQVASADLTELARISPLAEPRTVTSATTPDTEEDRLSAWSLHDLKRPLPLLAAVTGLAISAPVSLILSCNVHEIGHVLVAVPLGWKVERINLCLPGAGSVEYEHIGASAGNLEGFAGGIIAAVFLAAVYLLLLAARQRPLRGPGWWATGLGVVLWVGPQIVFGITEGVVGPERNYVDFIGDNPGVYLPLIVLSMVAGAGAHVWRWRAVMVPLAAAVRREASPE